MSRYSEIKARVRNEQDEEEKKKSRYGEIAERVAQEVEAERVQATREKYNQYANEAADLNTASPSLQNFRRSEALNAINTQNVNDYSKDVFPNVSNDVAPNKTLLPEVGQNTKRNLIPDMPDIQTNNGAEKKYTPALNVKNINNQLKQTAQQNASKAAQNKLDYDYASIMSLKDLGTKINKGQTLTPSEELMYANGRLLQSYDRYDGLKEAVEEYQNASSEKDNMQYLNAGTNGLYTGLKIQKADNDKNAAAKKIKDITGWKDDELNNYLLLAERIQTANDTDELRKGLEIDRNATTGGKIVSSIGNSALNLALAPTNGITAAMSNLEEKPRGFGNNLNSVYRRDWNTANEAENQVVENAITEAHPFGQKAYQIGMSTAQSAEMAVLGGAMGAEAATAGKVAKAAAQAASLIPFAASAYNSGYEEARERGASEKQSQIYGIAAGAAEAGTEVLSLDHLWGMAEGTKVGRNLVISWLAQAGIEASEEAASDIANRISDYFTMGKDGKNAMSIAIDDYKAQGYSEDEAKHLAHVDFWKQVGEDALAGGISGGIMGGGAVVAGTQNAKYNAQRSNVISDYYSNVAQNTETETEYGKANKELAEQYAQNPTQYIADNIDDSTKEGKARKEKVQEIAQKESEGKRLSLSDRAYIEESLAVAESEARKDENSMSSREKYENYLKEAEIVPNDYKTPSSGITETEARAQLTEAAKNGDAKAIGEVYNKMQNARSADLRYQADSILDEFTGRAENNGATLEEIESYKISPQEAYLMGNRGEETDVSKLSEKAAIAYNDGRIEYIEHQKQRVENAEELKGKVNTKDGEVTLKGAFGADGIITDNGTIKISDLTEDNGIKRAYTYADAQSTIAAKNAYIQNIRDYTNINQYDIGFNRLLNAGQIGLDYDKEVKNGTNRLYYNLMGEEAARNIYNAGVEIARAERDIKAQKAINSALNVKKGTGTFTDARTNKTLDVDTSFLDLFSKVTGYDITLTDKTESTERGSIDIKNSKITLTEDNSLAAIHESAHIIEELNADEYSKLSAAVMKTASKIMGAEKFNRALNDYHRTYSARNSKQTITESSGEFTNDCLVSIMSSEEGRKALADYMAKEYGAKEAKTIGEKIKELFNRIINSFKNMVANSEMNVYQKEMANNKASEYKDIIKQFIEALDGAIKNYDKVEGINSGEGEIKHSLAIEYKEILDDYSEHEIDNWKGSNKIFIPQNKSQFESFVNEAKEHKAVGKKAYFGKINSKTAQRIKNATGENVLGYNCTIHSSEIEKIFKSHGNEAKEAPRGQRAITSKDFAEIPNIIGYADKIEKASDYRGKPAVSFYKGDYTLYAVISNGRLDVMAQTLYAKKRSLPATIDERASINTPEAENGMASSDSKISQQEEKGKKKFSLKLPVEETADMIAMHNVSEKKLLQSIQLGGFPMPSIAVTKADQEYADFGDVTVLFNKETIDPANKENRVYSGDAWTPTFPTVEYKVNEKNLEKIAKRLNKSQADLETNVFDGTKDPIEALRNKEYAKKAFLDEKGIDPIPTHLGFDEVPAKAKYAVDKAPHAQVYIISNDVTYDKLINTPGMEKEIANAIREDGEGKTYGKVLNLKASTFERMVENVRRDAEYYAEEAETLKREIGIVKGEITESYKKDLGYTNGIDEAINEHKGEYEDFLKELTEGIEEKKGIYNNSDPYTASGTRKSFEQTHYDYSLNNLVRAMKEMDEQGAGVFIAGWGNVKGLSTERLNSIEEIKAERDRISKLPEEEIKKIEDGFSKRFNEIITELTNGTDDFMERDHAANAIGDALRESRTKTGFLRALKQYNKNATQTIADDVINLVKDIRMMPTKYLEAKPRRAVGLNEIAGVVIPNTASNELIKALDSNNISYKEYDAKKEGSRKDAVNSFENIKFSLGGIGAETANRDELKRAQDMAAAGKSAEEIFKDTGWYKGTDGKWRFEIDNSEMKVYRDGAAKLQNDPDYIRHEELGNRYFDLTDEEREEYIKLDNKLDSKIHKESYYLDEIIKHDELFKAYPNLALIKVNYDRFDDERIHGDYDSKKNKITINQNIITNEREFKEVLLHEIQHAIQRMEQFSPGSSREYWEYWGLPTHIKADDVKKNMEATAKYNEIRRNAPKEFLKKYDEYRDLLKKFGETQDETYLNAANLIEEELIKENESLFFKIDNADFDAEFTAPQETMLFPSEAYYATAGEIEAREASKRSNMTKEERRKKLPNMTTEFGTVFAENPTDPWNALKYSLKIDQSALDDNVKYSVDPDFELFLDIQEQSEGRENIQSAASILKEGMEALKWQKVDRNKVEKIARIIRNETNSKISLRELTDNLEVAFAYMQTNEHVEYNDMMRIVTEITTPVIEQSTQKLGEEEYASFVDSLRHYTIKLNENQRKEVVNIFGSYGNFRKAMSPLDVSTNGTTTLDGIWTELVEASNGMLKYDTNEGDMPLAIYDALQALKPTIANNFRGSEADLAKDYAMRIIEEYVSDSTAKKMKQTRAEFEKSIKEKYEKRYNETKSELLAKNKNSAKALREAQQIRHDRDMITKNAKKLMDMVSSPTDKKHVPKAMVDPIMDFLYAMDFIEPDVKYRNGKYYTRIFDHSVINPDGSRHNIFNTIEADTRDEVLYKFQKEIESGKGSKNQRLWVDRMSGIRELYDLVSKENADKLNESDTSGNSADSYLYKLDAQLGEELSDLLSRNKTININQLNAEDTHTLSSVVRNLMNAVNTANKASSMNEDIGKLAESTIRDGNAKGTREKESRAMRMPKKLLKFDMLTPETFLTMLGDSGEKIYKSLRKAQNKKFTIYKNVQEFMENTTDELEKNVKKDMKHWTGSSSRVHEIQLSEGKARVTEAQIMGLYETVKQEGASDRMRGGVRFDEINVTEKAIPRRYKNENVIHLTSEDVSKLFNILSPEQKALADKMQKYMATEGAKLGNEASMQLYGYEKFINPSYYPYTVDKNNVATTNSSENNSVLNGAKAWGGAKARVEGANNPLIIKDIFDVFTDHFDKMANYNANSAAIDDVLRWFNYKTSITDENGDVYFSSTKRALKQITESDEGTKYIIKLVRDLGQTESSNAISGMWDSLAGNFKAASVSGNMRVVAQQGTAYFRALNEVAPKYLMQSGARILTPVKVVKDIERVKELNPIAWYKSDGHWEVAMGQSLKSTMTGQQSLRDKIIEKSGFLAGFADDFTWSQLYHAVELEVKDKAKKAGETLSDEAYRDRVNERFYDVVDRTQVVDTTLSRSQFMRGKDNLNKMQSAFMAEPTKTYNMLYKAFAQDLSEGKFKRTPKAIAVYIINGVATAAAASAWDIVRKGKEDDEEDYGEAYLRYLKEGIIDNLNPTNLLPWVKEVAPTFFSIITNEQTYDPSRYDVDGINNLASSISQLVKYINGDSQKTGYGVYLNLAKGLSQITGVPLYTISRDVTGVYNLFADEPLKTTQGKKYEKLVNAMDKGNADKTEQRITNLVNSGISIKDIRSGIQSSYKDDYKEAMESGDTKAAEEIKEAVMLGYGATGMSEDEILGKLTEWAAPDTANYSDLDKAIDNGGDVGAIVNELKDLGKTDEAITKHIMNEYSATIEYEREHNLDNDTEAYVTEALKAIDSSYTYDGVKNGIEQKAAEKAEEDAYKAEIATVKTGLSEAMSGSFNADSITKAIDDYYKTGADGAKIKSYITSEYKEEYITAYQSKDYTGANELQKKIATAKAYIDRQEGTSIAKKYDGDYYQYEIDQIQKWLD